MNRVALNRRRFLKLVGATAFTYPFLRGVPSYAAGNNGGSNAPPYLVLLFTANGCIRYRWGAQGPIPTSLAPTATAVTTGPLQFRQTLSAFTQAGPSGQADLTKYVTVLDGLCNRAAGPGTHEPGMASLWTGLSATVSAGITVKGPSIDQAIASQLGASTPYPSLGMLVQSSADFSGQTSLDNRMLYDLGGNFVDPVASTPAATVSKLFPQMMMASGPDKKTFIRQQVWNHINGDLTSLQKRLCKEDATQIQNLQALWNQVLTQIQAAQMQAAACTKPSADTSSYDAGAGKGGLADPFPAYAQVMPNILAMTLACNLTQVASLQYSQALSPITHYWLGGTQTDTHHNYSHLGPASFYFLTGGYPEPTIVDIYAREMGGSNPVLPSSYPQQLVDIETWYAQQVANLAYTFSQVGPTGSTLLDRSVICWGSEIDMGAAHNHDDMPFVLIGGGAGKLKCTQSNGLLVRFPTAGTSMKDSNMVDQYGIRCHNDLLITLAQIMGVSTDQLQKAYGSSWSSFSSFVNGPITDILA